MLRICASEIYTHSLTHSPTHTHTYSIRSFPFVLYNCVLLHHLAMSPQVEWINKMHRLVSQMWTFLPHKNENLSNESFRRARDYEKMCTFFAHKQPLDECSKRMVRRLKGRIESNAKRWPPLEMGTFHFHCHFFFSFAEAIAIFRCTIQMSPLEMHAEAVILHLNATDGLSSKAIFQFCFLFGVRCTLKIVHK